MICPLHVYRLTEFPLEGFDAFYRLPLNLFGLGLLPGAVFEEKKDANRHCNEHRDTIFYYVRKTL